MNVDEAPEKGRLIVFPGGQVDTEDIGVPYVVRQGGQVPTADLIDPVSVAEDLKNRIAFVKGQELVRVLERGGSTSETIDVLLKEIAEELAHLKWERRSLTASGKSSANHTMGRVAGLRNLAEMLFKRKEAALAEKLDLKSPRMQKLFQTFLSFFHSSMEKCGVASEEIDLVFNQMKADMSDWEKKMETGD